MVEKSIKTTKKPPKAKGLKTLTIVRIFKPSLEALVTNVWPLLGLVFAPLFALIPISIIIVVLGVTLDKTAHASHGHSSDMFYAIVSIAIYIAVLGMIFLSYAAIAYAALQSAKGNKITFVGAMKAAWQVLGRFIGLTLTVTILVALGTVCLIVPGLFILKRYYLAPYYLIDHNRGIAEAMKQSVEDSKQYGGVWGLISIILITVIIYFVPHVGWLAAVVIGTFYVCAPAVRYVEIQKLARRAKSDKKAAARPRTSAA